MDFLDASAVGHLKSELRAEREAKERKETLKAIRSAIARLNRVKTMATRTTLVGGEKLPTETQIYYLRRLVERAEEISAKANKRIADLKASEPVK